MATKVKEVTCPFVIGEKYSRDDIYQIMSVPEERQRGNWETGYTRWGDDLFIFPTVGSAATGGFDYANRWNGDVFVWYAKNRSTIHQNLIQWIIGKAERVFIFTRPAVRNPFTFQGLGRVHASYQESPVRIDWKVVHPDSAFDSPEELDESTGLVEGATRQVTVNAYERSAAARAACITHFGWACSVCNFDFAEAYGTIGERFIHVHHLRDLASIGHEYAVDPIADLRPVCPNCHAMLHTTKPAMNVEQLQEIMRAASGESFRSAPLAR